MIHCEHESIKKKNEEPAFHDKNGKEWFMSWQLICKNCEKEWTEILDLSESEIERDKKAAALYNYDWFPNKK